MIQFRGRNGAGRHVHLFLVHGILYFFLFFFSSRRRHTRCLSDWSSDVCSSDLDKIEIVEKLCCLGDDTGKGGGAEESSIPRVRCAWGKFMDLKKLLTARGASLRRSEERRVGKECRSRW